MNKLHIALFFIFNIFLLNAQDEAEFADFDWEKSPKLHELSTEENELPEVNIYKKVVNEFAFEGEEIYSYYFLHKITKVNSDDAIEANNKIYIPLRSTIEVLDTKARVINSKGEVIELNKDDILEAEDEESKVTYQYFALEGVDKGSEIEYFYYLKRTPEMSGRRMTFQEEVPTKELKFAIVGPAHLIFEFKSLNGFPEMKEDTIIEDKNRWYADVMDMPELKDEPMSAYESSLQSVIYKLGSNKYSGKKEIYSYSDVAQNYYKNVNPELGKKTLKAIKNLIKESGANDVDDKEMKLRKLEQHLKTTIAYQSFTHLDLNNIDFILENKISSKLGLMRLYSACFNELDIKSEIVLTSNRYDNKFDKDFESYSFFEEEIFYVKDFKKYLAPAALFSRLGYIPAAWTNNFGLFIKPVTLGEFNSAVGKIKLIKPIGHEINSDTMVITVKFEEDVTEPSISFTKSQTGYEVMNVQPLYDFIEGEDETDTDEAIAKFINQDVDVDDVVIENKGGANFGVKPFRVSATLKDTELFVEKAGTKYLFKVGDLIGPQMEMYQEKGQERQLDVEMTYNHSYYRTITFNIPEGYQIKNLDDLNFDVSFTYEDIKSAYFISSYEQKGSQVTMTNEEVYDAMYYPKESFVPYRDVINAAADFNKVTLILEKL